MNIAGVTAEGLLDAYKTTGDSKYLTAAKKAGDFLKTGYSSNVTVLGSGNNVNAFNVKFLYDLGSVSGTSSYTAEATTLMNKVLTAYPLPQDLVNADANARVNLIEGVGEGIVPWDLFNYVSDANSAGNSSWANNLEGLAQTETIPSSTDPTYILGLSAFTIGGNATAKKLLQDAQNSDGTWSDASGTVQDTAYAVMALVKTGDMARAESGVKAGVKTQLANGGWSDATGGNNNEFSEVDSEVIQAISYYISQ